MAKISDRWVRKARRTFRAQKIVTIDELADLLQCSVSTARRRLKQWKTHTSYNQNGRYCVLPDVARFDADGLWRYRGIGFSRYGNLTQTVIHPAIAHRQSSEAIRQDRLGRVR